MFIGAIIAIFLAGSVAVGADYSLPGDVLYPIKTEVNERVMSAVALSDKADAKVQAHLAARRVQEAEDLDAEGKLDAETAANLNAAFGMHIKLAQEHLAELKASGDEEAYAEAFTEFKALATSHGEATADMRMQAAGSDEGVLHDFLDDIDHSLSNDFLELEVGDDHGVNDAVASSTGHPQGGLRVNTDEEGGGIEGGIGY